MRKPRWVVASAFLFKSVALALIAIISEQDRGVEPSLAGFVYEEKPGGYDQYFRDITVPFGKTESGYATGYRIEELQRAKQRQSVKKTFSDTLIWISRGPVNVGGRTRTVILDPDDPDGSTWYAGTAGGGIWKTEDLGASWTDLTPELPNLSTVSLAMAPGNTDVIYAGTGEGFGNVGGVTGDGIFVSRDRGETWEQIHSTRGNRNFFYVNKLWVDPGDDSVVIAATNTGIFKTLDAGETWQRKFSNFYRVQDLRQNPRNPNTLYASVNSTGIIKSYDRGETWIQKNNGIGNGLRFSVDVSPVDTSIVFTSVETPEVTLHVYISEDGGDNWRRHRSTDGKFTNFHGAQGWYNNAIKAHPREAKSVYIGGVYVGLLTFTNDLTESLPSVTRVDTTGTGVFLDFINFGAQYLGGGMSTGLDEDANVESGDFISVEIRFGPGRSQKAHRFMVPDGEGPGVPSTDYTYFDYVDVPFEVWDVTNNKQLMVSFRDQERDGEFNLIVRNPLDPVPGREYMFVSAYAYDPDSPHPDIVNAAGENKGGHFNKLLYFFWPTLSEEGVWNAEALPESVLRVEYGTFPLQGVTTEVLSSSSLNTSLHVDHHDFMVIPGETLEDDFFLVSANDGGIGFSANEGRTWGQRSRGFITTQFYGVAKKPQSDEFIGGLQDNGTYLSPAFKQASLEVQYKRVLGGDGFQTLWHPNRRFILASIYNNQFFRSSDGGYTFAEAYNGIEPLAPGGLPDGPFISKLSFNRENPDVVFAIGARGIYKHTSFGDPDVPWELIPMDEGFTLFGSAPSTMNVKVSRADADIVWAGTGMFPDPLLNIFVSNDQGDTFTPVSQYEGDELGYISGMATHPYDPNTAYLLFSYYQSPKILRTTDLGVTWEDISGFRSDTVSSTGFPDVSVHDLMVMPHDPNVIWAATEIGIVESLDNGATWQLLDSDFPNVSVYQIDYQDEQIILATHGRGIWTAGNFELPEENTGIGDEQLLIADFDLYPNPAGEYIHVRLKEARSGTYSISLYTLSGQRINSEIRSVSGPGDMVTVRLDELMPGTYIVEVRGEGLTATRQLVVY